MRRIDKAMIAGGAVAAGLLALWLSLPGLLAARWTAQLRAMGYPQAEMGVNSIGWSHATGAFSLGGEQGADRVEIAFTPAGLWSGRMDGVKVTGLRLVLPAPGGRLVLPVDGPVTFADAHLIIKPTAGLPELRVTGGALLTPLPDGGWRAQGDGRLLLDQAEVPVQAGFDWGEGGLSAIRFGFTPVADGPKLNGTGTARRSPDGRWMGEADLTGRDLPAGLPDMVLRWKGGQGDASLEWKGVARLEALLDPDGQGRHRLGGRLQVTDLAGFAQRLGQPDIGLTGGPIFLAFQAESLLLDARSGEWPAINLRLDARGIGLGGGPRDNQLALGTVLRRIEGNWWLAPLPDIPGSLSVPTLGVAGRGVVLAGAVTVPLDLDLHLADLRLPWLAPVSWNAKLRGDPAGEVRAEWSAATQAGARLSGALDLSLATGVGNAVARLAPVRLAPDGLSATGLFPGGPLPDGLTGTVAARMTAAWNAERADGTAALMLEDAGIALPSLRLSGINGVLRFDRLSPLSMPPQSISFGRADLGITLTGGVLGLSLPGDGSLRVTPEPLTWVGQRVTVPPSTFRIGNDHLDLSLEMSAIPLPAALSALGVEGLSADGILIGSIPVRIDSTGAHLGPGLLRAAGPGRLAWPYPIPPSWLDPARNENLALVTRALADYRYSTLELILSGQGHRLSLDGGNPGLYGGYAMPMSLIMAPMSAQASANGPPPVAVAAEIAAFKARKD